MRAVYGLAAFAAITTAVPANAAVFAQIYTGTITSGLDASDLFGGGDLTGLSYSVTYVFDSARGKTGRDYEFDYSGRYLFGGSGYGSNPNLSTAVTVNGKTYTFIGTQYSDLQSSEDHRYLFARAMVSQDQRVYSFIGDIQPPYIGFYQAGQHFDTLLRPGVTEFSLQNTVFSGSVLSYATSGLPEPATWAMMVIGFGAVGAAMRKRQRVTLAYA